MTREEKAVVVENLKEQLDTNNFFYIADSSELTVEQVNKLRGLCFDKGIKLQVVKNTLVKKAMESLETDYSGLYDSLKGPTSLMFSTVSNDPAKVIKEFRKESEKPILKAAYIDSDVYIGDDQLDALSTLKSREELIGEIITLLRSPVMNLMSSLTSGQNRLAGIIKTLSEKEG